MNVINLHMDTLICKGFGILVKCVSNSFLIY